MLKFDHRQWQSLGRHQDERFVDAVVRGLKQDAALFDDTHPDIVRQLARHGLARAQAHGLDDDCRLAQFVHLMAEVSSVFDLHPDIARRLGDPALSPPERFDGLLEEADDALWSAAGLDDSLSGWYLRERCDGLSLADRWALALGRALPSDDLPEPAARAAAVAAAMAAALQAGCKRADDQFIWAACACAYGPAFVQAMPWSAEVFAPSRPAAVVTGMLRVRLAIDFAAWL